jgi:hypothetical protein
MKKLNKATLKKYGGPAEALIDALSPIFSPEKIKFHKVRITEFVKSKSTRWQFSEHPVYVSRDNESYYAKYLMDSTTFEKSDLTINTSLFGFNVTGKFSFMGEVSKFYIPAGLVYSIINNRIESAIPKEFINLIIEVETPAVVVFNVHNDNFLSKGKFFIKSLTYLFKESGKYLNVFPFNHSDSTTPFAKSTVLRFFEFLLNLTQFFNENEKVTPFCYETEYPEPLTSEMIEKFRNYSFDYAHEQGSVRITEFVNVNINEHIINKVNEAYSKARKSFNFLGLDPIEALEDFILLLKFAG